MADLIDRQAAIDIERNATVDTNPSHFEAHQKFTQFMDDAEVSSFGRWQWSNGFNTALTAVGIDLKKLPSAQPDHSGDVNGKVDLIYRQSTIDAVQSIGRLATLPDNDAVIRMSAVEYVLFNMPSAQPEIIRCKDCGYYDPTDNDEESDWCHVWGETTEENAFCSYAKRKGEKDATI